MSDNSHDMIAHLWANRSRPSARGHNMFFDGDTIYSYGRHFPIARWVERKGRRAILFTTRHYSMSTSKHIGIVRQAIPAGVPIFMVEDPSAPPPSSARARAIYETRVDERLIRASRAGHHVKTYVEDAERIVREGNAFAEFYGHRWRLTMPQDRDDAIALAKLRAERELRRTAAARKRQQAKAAKEAVERIKLWLGGRNVSTVGFPEILLRLDGDKVETSLGAEFPVADAKRVFPLIRQCHDERRGINPLCPGSSRRLGAFTIDRIHENGDVTAGCHYVKWAEIERLARDLGLMEGAAA